MMERAAFQRSFMGPVTALWHAGHPASAKNVTFTLGASKVTMPATSRRRGGSIGRADVRHGELVAGSLLFLTSRAALRPRNPGRHSNSTTTKPQYAFLKP